MAEINSKLGIDDTRSSCCNDFVRSWYFKYQVTDKERTMEHNDDRHAAHAFALISLGPRSRKKNTAAPTRRLILIDIENYCGKGALTSEDVHNAKRSISREFNLQEEDLVVIGTSHGSNCLISGTEWKGPRQVLMRGHDGADLALINASREYRIDTFAAVILISGDGIFAETAKGVRAFSKPVIVAARNTSMSRKLVRAASAVRYVEPDELTAA